MMLGHTVLYRLSDQDVQRINQGRERHGVDDAFDANPVKAGQQYPAVIVRAFGPDASSAVNLQVQLDGPDGLWVTSRPMGDGDGQWIWPPADATH